MGKVELIPLDPDSDQHARRLYDQRVACGWHQAAVPAWREAQLGESKVMYWIVPRNNLPGRGELLDRHLAAYPKEHETLTDTSTKVFGTPREATDREFLPVGHIALAPVTPEEAKELSLPSSSVWLQNFYVSWAVQRGGVGRGAMAAAELAASSPPLNASAVALDTLRGEVQKSETFLKKAYDDRGMDRPIGYRSNQEWYAGQGYEVMDGPGYSTYVDPMTGEVETVPIVYMRKDLE